MNKYWLMYRLEKQELICISLKKQKHTHIMQQSQQKTYELAIKCLV